MKGEPVVGCGYDADKSPIAIGWRRGGWELVSIVDYPHPKMDKGLAFFTGNYVAYQFRSDAGDWMHCPWPRDGRPFMVRDAKEAIWSYVWSKEDRRLALEYARMC